MRGKILFALAAAVSLAAITPAVATDVFSVQGTGGINNQGDNFALNGLLITTGPNGSGWRTILSMSGIQDNYSITHSLLTSGMFSLGTSCVGADNMFRMLGSSMTELTLNGVCVHGFDGDYLISGGFPGMPAFKQNSSPFAVPPGTHYAAGFDATLRSFGAVPEPASWVMMIGGFGLVGMALRSRRGNKNRAIA